MRSFFTLAGVEALLLLDGRATGVASRGSSPPHAATASMLQASVQPRKAGVWRTRHQPTHANLPLPRRTVVGWAVCSLAARAVTLAVAGAREPDR